jgi:hypothetical protein
MCYGAIRILQLPQSRRAPQYQKRIWNGRKGTQRNAKNTCTTRSMNWPPAELVFSCDPCVLLWLILADSPPAPKTGRFDRIHPPTRLLRAGRIHARSPWEHRIFFQAQFGAIWRNSPRSLQSAKSVRPGLSSHLTPKALRLKPFPSAACSKK